MSRLLLEYALTNGVGNPIFLAFGLGKVIGLAGLTWWFCGFSMWLWNRRFRLTLRHHLLCGFAAMMTLITLFTFQCLLEVRRLALASIHLWQEEYATDNAYGWASFVQVSESLQQLYRQKGWEWDSKICRTPPHQLPASSDRGSYKVPLDKSEARELSLKIYVERAIEHFANGQPVLRKLLWSGSVLDMEPLRNDLANYQASHPNDTYNFTTGSTRIAGEQAAMRLDREISQQLLVLRLELVALFIIGQGIAFGFAAYSAYSDLKTNR